MDDSSLDAVRHTADGGAEVRRVVLVVLLLGVEAEDDVLVRDAEFLYDGSQWEEAEGGFLGHFCWC